MAPSAPPQTHRRAHRFPRARASLYALLAIALLIFEFLQVWSGIQNVRRWRSLDQDGVRTPAEITGRRWDDEEEQYEVWIAFEDPTGFPYSGRLFLSQTEAATWKIEDELTLPLIIHPDAPWLVYRLPDADDPPLLWQALLVTNPESARWGMVAAFVLVLNGVIVIWLWRARRLWRARWQTSETHAPRT